MRNTVLLMTAVFVLSVCCGCKSLIKALNDDPSPRRPAAEKKVQKKQSDGIFRRTPPPSGLSDHLSATEREAIAAQRQDGIISRSEFKNNEENERRTSKWVFGR